MNKRVGIFGGTFDPIHYGHLIAAQHALEELKLSRVIFVAAGAPPHKQGRLISPSEDRYKMVKLAITGNRDFTASDVELSRDSASYTVDSLRKIVSRRPGAELYLLIGLDQALTLSSWKAPEEIFKMCRVVVMSRPGHNPAAIERRWRRRVALLSIPLIEISASDIRQRVRRGADISYMVPASVADYIKRHKLYRNDGCLGTAT